MREQKPYEVEVVRIVKQQAIDIANDGRESRWEQLDVPEITATVINE